MNTGVKENEFRRGLKELLDGIAREEAPDAPDPYAGAGEQVLHEHDTRIYFFDRVLTLLGWNLGLGGDVAEEARVKADTTKFVDYVGINGDTRAPALIVEAKAWDKPFISGVGRMRGAEETALIIAAIKHIREGGRKDVAPVVGEWHDYLAQVTGYVQTFKARYGHDVPCAMLASGRWLLVFTMPVTTFCEGEVNDSQFKIFRQADYVVDAHKIFALLAKSKLASVAPVRLRSAQLGNYVSTDNVMAAFHAVLVRYEESGAALFTPQPRILVYPALLVQREDGALFNVIDDEAPIVMNLDKSDDGEDSLAPHIALVAKSAAQLLARCADELGEDLVAFDLSDFPGFPDDTCIVEGEGLPLGAAGKCFVKPLRMAPDQWLVVTGHMHHYLLERPQIACRFHAWTECRTVHHEIGQSAINSRATRTPRAFFVDEQVYHCAHQVVQDRRQDRCHIAPIDMRTCCRACAFQNICWTADDLARLPCGQ